MKIRLECLPQEIDPIVDLLRQAFDVLSVSTPYANRGDSRLVRVYVEFIQHGDIPPQGVDAPKRTGYSSRRQRRTRWV